MGKALSQPQALAGFFSHAMLVGAQCRVSGFSMKLAGRGWSLLAKDPSQKSKKAPESEDPTRPKVHRKSKQELSKVK